MSEQEFDRERHKIRQTFGGNRKEAGNCYEQQIARLFVESGGRWRRSQKKKSAA
jgi:hypothetical protein